MGKKYSGIGEARALIDVIADKGSDDDDDDDVFMEIDGSDYFNAASGRGISETRQQSIAADRLSMRLLAIDDDDNEMEDLILHETFNIAMDTPLISSKLSLRRKSLTSQAVIPEKTILTENTSIVRDQIMEKSVENKIFSMTGLCILAFVIITGSLWVGAEFIGPPNQPVGPYSLVERQEGEDFFGYYTFYDGPDSVGSNGFVNYVSHEKATSIEIANVTYEVDILDQVYHRKKRMSVNKSSDDTAPENDADFSTADKTEPFLYLKTAPTKEGPRDSIRLEGKRRFNRGLFIVDVRHMPVGCGAWPAFWLTDEANWPVNGEVDIVEGVNFQSEAKTALHTTKGCDMYDVPAGTMTGTWDTAVGIPDKKTGIPDMTFREAKNCFVYDPHQWINQGCVAIDNSGGSLGAPLNEKGGGIFALEWDPANRHIRTWVFSPHTTVPENIVESIRTAGAQSEADRIMPNPESWPLPYGYFPIGDQTNCDGTKFRNMRLILNTAICGSVTGNRFFLDCKNESKAFKSCNEYIRSRPEALDEFYWKIRGVYVYQREWRKAWNV